MGKLDRLVFRVKDAYALATWYRDVLGMQVDQSTSEVTACYPGGGITLVFRDVEEGEPEYVADSKSVYWKIGICLKDVDLARDRIMDAGVKVSPARQFMDIGYLAFVSDPRGFSIELLQTTFHKRKERLIPEEGLKLGQKPIIGQVTTRCADIQATLAVYEASLGMKLLSVQDVPQYGFCLYFLAATDEEPPGPVHSVEIREWLWNRSYTTLEFRHEPGATLTPLDSKGEGVQHLELKGAAEKAWDKLGNLGIKTEEKENVFTDCDGFRVHLKS